MCAPKTVAQRRNVQHVRRRIKKSRGSAQIEMNEEDNNAMECRGKTTRENMVRPERFELPTCCSGGNRSIQLSYGRNAMTTVYTRG
jgi:hypothetical protein